MEIIRWPKGGLNLDDSPELLSPEDWSYAANIVAGRSYQSKNGEKEHVRGTTELVSAVDLTGCVHIGTIRSAEDDVSYLFFYHATAANQCIVKFANGVTSLVLRWSGLNFQNSKQYRINGGGVVGNLLYFTDNYNQPRCVHLTRYAGGTTPASEEEILHIKRGPQLPPEIDTASLSLITKPTPYDETQFAYQYEYTDGQLSVISPWTPAVIFLGPDAKGSATQVAVRIGPTESIPVLVSKIKMVARDGNTGTPHYWLDIEGPTFDQATYAHLYKGQNFGTVPDIYLKSAELVPLTAKCESVTKSRAWFGNFVEGYDTPTSGTTLTFALENTTSLEDIGPMMSRNAKLRLGVVYHDSEGRSCGVVDGDWVLETPTLLTQNPTRQHIKYRITGTPPAWADSFSLVITRDMKKTYFLESRWLDAVGQELYVEWDFTNKVETFTNTYNETTAIAMRLSLFNLGSKGRNYSYKDGDYVLVTNEDTATTYGPLKIKKTEGDWLYVEPVDLGAVTWYVFQIYSPNRTPSELYYEVARRKIVGGVMDTTDFYFYGDSINLPTDSSNFQPQMKFRPNEGGWTLPIGKPFIETNIGQVAKKTFIRYSSPFIAGTNVNGLSEFNSGDEGSVPIEATEIQKLQPTSKEGSDGEVILAICNSDTYSVYVDEARMSTNDGQSLVIGTVDVIGDVRKQAAGFGTLHPESVIEEGGSVCWWDQLARSYVRYSTNGIFPISEYKAVSHFEEQAELNDSSDLVVSGFDPFTKMWVVTFTNASTATRKTIGFSEVANRWISFYDFAPEGYIIGSKKMYSILYGLLYTHDDVANFNNFYGAAYNSKIKLSMNDGPDAPKEWKAWAMHLSPNFFSWSDGNQIVADAALRVDISNRHGQETSILFNEFEVDEHVIYGEIRGDENSSGGVLDGDPIYSNTIQVEITFSGVNYKQFLFAKAGFQESRGHEM